MLASSRSAAAVAAALALVLTVAPASRAGEARTHDGFLLRLSAGGGWAKTSADTPLGDAEASGPAGDVNFAIGGAVAPNLILHGTLWGWAVHEPDVEIGSLSGSPEDVTLDMSAWGVGITYYVMPANLYLSPSVGAAELTIEEDGVSVSTDIGIALDFTLGKEWWVGDNWGLGVAGAVSLHKVPDGDLDEDWTGPSFAVRFSATMN
jgi:hypothetical protein